MLWKSRADHSPEHIRLLPLQLHLHGQRASHGSPGAVLEAPHHRVGTLTPHLAVTPLAVESCGELGEKSCCHEGELCEGTVERAEQGVSE